MREKPKAYTAWLIERRNPQLYWDGRDWTPDVNEAVKFRFEEDALRVYKHLGRITVDAQVFTTHHQWGFTDELVEGV